MPVLDDLHDEVRSTSLLQKFGFSDYKTTLSVFQRLESRDRQGLSEIFSFLLYALGDAADSDRSLINFERFVEVYGPGIFTKLLENKRAIEILITLFSTSPFLTEILLLTPNSIALLNDRASLVEHKTIEQFQAEALSESNRFNAERDQMSALRRYQRRQYLRIGTSDFLGLYDLRTVLSQLSRLAVGLVRASTALASKCTGVPVGKFVIIAMGKLGGWEFNYSSDIDLIFLVKNDRNDYLRLAKKIVEYLSSTTQDGFLYRVDLRLRPWGNDGPLIATQAGYLQYIKEQARLWEKQAFLKARSIAGNISFGEEIRREVEPYIFRAPADEVRAGIFAMKKRTESFLKEKSRSWGEIKLGEGAIRDIEFVVQSLQMIHPFVRTRATLKAIPLLREAGFLTPEEAHILIEGYTFLRTVEHYIQMIDYRQINTLPSDKAALSSLARRLGFDGTKAGETFIERYEQHCRAIRKIFMKYLGEKTPEKQPFSFRKSPQLYRHITLLDASYAASFSAEEIERHVALVNSLDNKNIVVVEAKPLAEKRWRVTIVGYDYLGELSLICGLMFVYGFDIIESQAFTYAISDGKDPQKIVDVFLVQPVPPERKASDLWSRYTEDLQALLSKTRAGKQREARGDLVKRVGEAFQAITKPSSVLYPIDIEIDNESSQNYTILRISTIDTVGFLFEFSNALALNHINISRMIVQSIGNKVNDAIYVTDEKGGKIILPERQRELRAATVLTKHFTHLLPNSPDPAMALLHFREFLGKLFERSKWPDELVKLEQPEVLDALAKLLGGSEFLWEDFLRMQYSNLFPVVRDVDSLVIVKSHKQLDAELRAKIDESEDWRTAVNQFKDREMFRIDMRHIVQDAEEFWDFSNNLTDLVEVVVSETFHQSINELYKKYGETYLDNAKPCIFAVFALGKFGGRELGFASDIELMLIYSGRGQTTGPDIIPANEFYEKLVQSFMKSIHARQEGIFRIDLQLRPYGKAGNLAVTLEAFQHYFEPNGPAWAYERQALVKLRPVFGDQPLARLVCDLRDQYTYNGEPFDIVAMHAMRERQIRHLVTAGTFNAKFSPGGLVDVEYLVQGLQITHASSNPALRLPNTRLAMEALVKAGILNTGDYDRLRKAHTFLRWLIDSLRVVRGNSKDVNLPPADSEEFAFLARRLRYGSDTNRLLEDLQLYPNNVIEINQRLFAP